jgi:putative hydrolase of the HAD superfamily
VVSGVLFDVDDTLVDHAGASRGAILARLREVGLPHGAEAADRWRALDEQHFGRFLTGEIGFQEQRRARVRGILEKDLDDPAADAWFAAYNEQFESAWACFDDVLAALALLDARGLPVGVVTNLDTARQRYKLDRVGLSGRFRVLVGLDSLGVGKPDPAVFRHACELLGTEPSDTAFVGDRLDHDALGARDAGLLAVWLDRTGRDTHVPEGVTRVRSLAELEEVLA